MERLSETGLGQKQEVLVAAADDASGAITRAFAVRSSAGHGATVTSFDTMRWRKSSASGPATRTYSRGRAATLA